MIFNMFHSIDREAGDGFPIFIERRANYAVLSRAENGQTRKKFPSF